MKFNDLVQEITPDQQKNDAKIGIKRGAKGRFDKGNQSGYKYVPKTPVS